VQEVAAKVIVVPGIFAPVVGLYWLYVQEVV
jgi:hypothetical protein